METADLDRSDLTARIEEARHVAADAPDARSLHDLGVLLLKSYECYGGPAVAGEALGVLRQAVEVSLAAGTGWNGPRGVLGAALVTQYEIEGDPATLDEAIDLLSAVVRETPGDSVSGTDYRIELGVALEARVWETGSAQDADAAVELARSALADTPDDTVDHLVIRSNLANALLTRYEVAGGPGHVAEAVTHARTVADAFPQTDPRRASMFANLSTALHAAFDESGKITDLSDAVDAARLGVRFAVASDPGLPGYLVNLANGLFCLSEASGDSGLIDEAVAAARRAVVAVIGTAVTPAPRILRNEAATRDAVRAGLARHPWFHFAGHSHQDLLHPARAGLCLGDGDLSALAIATQRLAGGELAYLSSCEGAVPGTQVPDEPLHLALAFQIAGYRNVIATLWSVSDLGAAKVTQAIYRRLARDGPIDADGTARALHAVTLELRDRYPHEIWAAYLHAGV